MLFEDEGRLQKVRKKKRACEANHVSNEHGSHEKMDHRKGGNDMH